MSRAFGVPRTPIAGAGLNGEAALHILRTKAVADAHLPGRRIADTVEELEIAHHLIDRGPTMQILIILVAVALATGLSGLVIIAAFAGLRQRRDGI